MSIIARTVQNYTIYWNRTGIATKKKNEVICADPCYQDVAGGGDSAGGISGGATGAETTGARAAGFFFAFFTTLFLTFFLATFFLAFFGKDKFHLHYHTIVVENSINVCSNPGRFADNLRNAQSCKWNRVHTRQFSGSMLSDEQESLGRFKMSEVCPRSSNRFFGEMLKKHHTTWKYWNCDNSELRWRLRHKRHSDGNSGRSCPESIYTANGAYSWVFGGRRMSTIGRDCVLHKYAIWEKDPTDWFRISGRVSPNRN